jgi:cytochrome c
MDDRSNTIAGWVLGAGIAALGFTILSSELGHSEAPEKEGWAIEGASPDADSAAAVPLPVLLASADAAKGEAVFKKCTACHTIAPGGANGIGPNLAGVMGKPLGAHAGFAYSDSLKAVGGTWTFDQMDKWLAAPKKFAAGTKMSFAGLGKAEERANLIVYLNNQGSNLPLPKVDAAAAAPAAEGAAPAGATPPAAAPAAATPATPATAVPAPAK